MVLTRNKIEEMRWPQPKSPPQTENSAVAGVVNNTISPRKLKAMDCRLHWIICREDQGQLRYYWASRSLNWGDYRTKHPPPPSPPLSRSKRNVIFGTPCEHIRHTEPVGSSKGVLFQVPGGTYFHLEP